MRVYLAGPMTGYPAFNYPAFDKAATDLRERGHDVQSPAEMDDPALRAIIVQSPDGDLKALQAQTGEGYGNFLARDIQIVASDAIEAVVVLPGWERSRGATLEVHVAKELGKPILRYPTLEPVTRRHPSSERFHTILRDLAALHDRKSVDYGSEADPFANVRAASSWGVPEWVGAMIRATDKVRRLESFARRGSLANESAVDAFDDLAVYAVIARVLYEEATGPA